jgi:hypothetical protein
MYWSIGMKTHFMCLANSKKLGGRCVAGVEVSIIKNNVAKFLFNDNRPKWIRPVSYSEHGEVSDAISGHLKLLDIVALDINRRCPKKAQTENVFFKQEPLQVVGSLKPSIRMLDALAVEEEHIFGNRLNYVSDYVLDNVDHSLVLIKTDDFSYFVTVNKKGERQVRAIFTHKNINYDLPITDLLFSETYPQMTKMPAYLTISLGEVFKGKSYKLIASVIIL